MNIGQWLAPQDVIHRAGASDKRQALQVIAEHAVRGLDLPTSDVLDALLSREAVSSTGVGHGVAVPHARLVGLTAMRGVFVRLDHAVPFGAVDDQPVDLIFTLFAPTEAGFEHLRALAKAARLLRRADLREQLRLARSADALYALLVQEAAEASAA